MVIPIQEKNLDGNLSNNYIGSAKQTDNNNQNISGVNTQSEITQTDNIQNSAIGVDGITQTDSGKDSITQTNPTIIKDILSQTNRLSSTTDTSPILYNNTIKPHT